MIIHESVQLLILLIIESQILYTTKEHDIEWLGLSRDLATASGCTPSGPPKEFVKLKTEGDGWLAVTNFLPANFDFNKESHDVPTGCGLDFVWCNDFTRCSE